MCVGSRGSLRTLSMERREERREEGDSEIRGGSEGRRGVCWSES